MKKSPPFVFLFIAFTIVFCCLRCKKNKEPINVILYNKPLSVIESYINRKWRLQYAKGGISSIQIYPATHNSYIQLSNDRIVIGNDSAGVVVDTLVHFNKIEWPGSLDDSTYLLSYFYSPRYGFSYNYFIDGIFNDTLKLHDFASDAVYYYYTKFN